MRKFVIIGALLIVGSCSSGRDVPQATTAIGEFHRSINAGHFDGIYDASSDDMKKSSPRERLTTILAAVHRKLGLFRSGRAQGWNDTINTSGHFVTLNFAAHYERDPAAMEQFVYRIDGDRTALAGYNINSTLMVLN